MAAWLANPYPASVEAPAPTRRRLPGRHSRDAGRFRLSAIRIASPHLRGTALELPGSTRRIDEGASPSCPRPMPEAAGDNWRLPDLHLTL